MTRACFRPEVLLRHNINFLLDDPKKQQLPQRPQDDRNTIAMASSFVGTVVKSCAMHIAHCSSGAHACAPLGLPLHTTCHTIMPNRLLMLMMHSKQHTT